MKSVHESDEQYYRRLDNMQRQLDAIWNLPSGPNGGPIVPTVKRHNPPDLTLRNLRALTKRVDLLVRQMQDRTRRIDMAERGGITNYVELVRLSNRLKRLERKR